MGSEIVVCGRRYDIEHRVVTFEDRQGYDAYLKHRTDNPSLIYADRPAKGLEGRDTRYRARRLLGAERSLESLRQVVRQVVVHFDGCADAATCFNVLHNERGLSVHFMVDNDGTIYQTLDLADCAFHAAGVNEVSVGIEIQNMADAARFPHAYGARGARNIVSCRVHGEEFLAFDFTEAQYEAMTRLSTALGRILRVPFETPRVGGGLEHAWTVIDDPRSFQGFLGHYHVTREKWDPGPWDFARMFRRAGARITFPLSEPKSLISDGAFDPKRFQQASDQYFEDAERSPGRFPVGPFGESRMWHGGVHLTGSLGDPVFAPLGGRVVAAQSTTSCGAGSCNFILMRHRLDAGDRIWPFFSLYYHVAEETAGPDAPTWLTRRRSTADILAEGRVALLDEPVLAGERIGRLGEAGPSGARAPQLHFAVFADHDIAAELEPGYFRVVEGGVGRFCAAPQIIDVVDRPEGGRPADGLLSRRELMRFFKNDPERLDFRRMVVHHRSEWTQADWRTELAAAPDFAKLSSAERARLVEEQLAPTLWWKPLVAQHAGLPESELVYSYHPIGFLIWYEALERRRLVIRTHGIQAAAPGFVPSTDTSRFKLDAESSANMTDSEDQGAAGVGQKMTLEELMRGYGD